VSPIAFLVPLESPFLPGRVDGRCLMGKMLNRAHESYPVGGKRKLLGVKVKSCPLFCAVFRVCYRLLLANLGSLIANMKSKFAKKLFCEK